MIPQLTIVPPFELSLTTSPRYISDVGAYGLKPLFIAGSVVTVVFLDLAFLSERWLRHAGQLAPNKGKFDKACAILSLFFAVAGAAGLILLSIFDTARHPKLHDGFLALFLFVPSAPSPSNTYQLSKQITNLPPLQCRLHNKRHPNLRRIPLDRNILQRPTPHSPSLLHNQTRLHHNRSRSRHRFRRLHEQQ